MARLPFMHTECTRSYRLRYCVRGPAPWHSERYLELSEQTCHARGVGRHKARVQPTPREPLSWVRHDGGKCCFGRADFGDSFLLVACRSETNKKTRELRAKRGDAFQKGTNAIHSSETILSKAINHASIHLGYLIVLITPRKCHAKNAMPRDTVKQQEISLRPSLGLNERVYLLLFPGWLHRIHWRRWS